MQSVKRFVLPALTILAACILPAMVYAASINLYDSPDDKAKVTGTIDLSAGVIPIYTPKDSVWVKVGDPRNGNTGWVKSSELKDSNGNAITFSQNISDNGKSQSVEMTVGTGKPLTPEQKKANEQLILQQQQATQESLVKAQQGVNQALTEIQKIYQQQLQIFQKTGIPMLSVPVTTPQPLPQTPAQPASTTPAMVPR